MGEELDYEVCCDGLRQALESGGVQLVEMEPDVYCEAIPAADGKSGIAINFCPFCGEPRPGAFPGGEPSGPNGREHA